ncbi:cell division protein FtsW [Acidocella aquatica]|uniref:Probable peptidoglycan glycosyltransferase FtsW n=1 Tax=Acidocella aquatica TaxID=1922313 RepID=A0ABQ6A586_9PROT|nr:putative peptidoglycan glycosyltransferase FtsW [Acidocella aquatica]GLR66462.1 cell division protein FtsW [Acidocella aquatica]
MPPLSRADTSVIGRWWWSVDRVTLLALAVLIGIGYVLALAATPGISMRLTDPHTMAMVRQIFFLAMGGGVMLGMSMLSLRQVKLSALGLGIVFFFLTGFTLVHGVEVDGAHRWISLPGFTIQPSEFLRPGFIIITAWLIAESRRTPGFPGKRAALGVFLITALMLKMQPDIGMTFLFTMVVFSQFYLDGMEVKWVGVAAALVVLAFIGAFMFISHVHTRVELFLHPTKTSAYQALTALSAFGNGGMFGLGPGEGQVKHYLPDARADFVFAVAGEEFGLFFCGFIIFVFASIVMRALVRLLAEPNLFVVLAAGGLIVGFGLQAFVNMASSLSLIPTKGMTLPFISYGGSSVLAISIQMGFLLALTRKRHQGDYT